MRAVGILRRATSILTQGAIAKVLPICEIRMDNGIHTEQNSNRTEFEKYELMSVWGDGPDNLYLAGAFNDLAAWPESSDSLSKVFKWDGESFGEFYSSLDECILAVRGLGNDLVFLGGTRASLADKNPYSQVKMLIWNKTNKIEPSFDFDLKDVGVTGMIFGFSVDDNNGKLYAYTNEGWIFETQFKE